jgi:hypothetical protein
MSSNLSASHDLRQSPMFLDDSKLLQAFPSRAASIQAPVHVSSDLEVKDSHPVPCAIALVTDLYECKANLSRAAVLPSPDSIAPLALVTDTSSTSVGAVLQQRMQGIW